MRLFTCALVALAIAVRAHAAPPIPRPGEASPDAADRLYRRSCARCHGDDLTGSLWREINPEMPDFTSAAWHAGKTDARLLASILDGKSPGMPSFRGKLSGEQARALVARLRQAAPDFVPARPPDPGPDEFDRRYDELTREMEMLKKQFYDCGGPRGP